MLVLSRTPQEGIHVGKDIRVVVLEVRGEKVKLGVEAPREVAVWRDELAEEGKDVK